MVGNPFPVFFIEEDREKRGLKAKYIIIKRWWLYYEVMVKVSSRFELQAAHFFKKGTTINPDQKGILISNFCCMNLNPNIFFSNLNSNLLGMRNLHGQVKKSFCYQKLFLPFTVWTNFSSDLKNLYFPGLFPWISKMFLEE